MHVKIATSIAPSEAMRKFIGKVCRYKTFQRTPDQAWFVIVCHNPVASIQHGVECYYVILPQGVLLDSASYNPGDIEVVDET